MLSRIAESLFWIGRYVERADDTARILDVHTQLLVEDPWVDEDAACRTLLAVMGMTPDAALDAASDDAPLESIHGDRLDIGRVLALVAFDPLSPSSIAGALSAARENARGVREVVSAEMWEALNITHNALPNYRALARRQGPHTFFRFVRERAAVIAGLADATISRDDTWRFLVLGRSLERVDMTARLLFCRVLAGESAPSWTTMLRSCGAYEPYLRTYRGAVDASRAAEFLLLDRLFPRSVFAALQQAERCLAELDTARARVGVADEARRVVGRARTVLEFLRPEEVLSDLPRHLEELERTCSAASNATTTRFFQQSRPLVWLPEGAA